MGMSKVYFVHLLIQLYFVPIIICQTDFTYHFCIDTYDNYTNTSAYKANLNTVLSSISSDTQTDSGYYNLSVGHDPNTVNAIALCRGDITAQECHRCLNDSANKLPQVCPTQKEAVGWYELCMLRYSNRSILGISDVQHVYFLNNVNNVSNVDEFNRVLGNLLGSLQSEAASGNSLLKFATGQANVGDYDRVYALAQCSPDLGVQSCTNCLGSLIRLLPNCCASKQGSRVAGPSCAIRYEMYLFYNLPSPPPPSPALFPPPPLPALFPPPSSSNSSISTGNGSNTAKIAIGIAVPIALIVAFTVGFWILCRKPRKRVEGSPSSHYQDEYEESKSLHIVVHHNIDDARDKPLENPSSNEHSITDLYPR
ncbi:hypothetical protein BVRB_8g186770 [Beta vulgaris subsp. vulgaris]|nr:hypothetical protein BVRB_8g186770 [Beta vulgaris subsp. vulgaris]